MQKHPDQKIQELTIGSEGAPLLVIDNVVADAESLVEAAAAKLFSSASSYYPGLRSKAPLAYQRYVLEQFNELFTRVFSLGMRTLNFTSCHFSLMTTPPEKLAPLQCIPHVDSLDNNELAFVHYLFKKDLGGTAFYRHRKTGFEFVDESRKEAFFREREREMLGPDKPPQAYIHGDTALYEQIGRQEARFNRMLIYRRSSLHSGDLAPGFVPDLDPRTGRLSLNGFLQ